MTTPTTGPKTTKTQGQDISRKQTKRSATEATTPSTLKARKGESTLDEVTFNRLAGDIGDEWTTLATHLGISDAKVGHIRANYQMRQDQIFQMLLTWWRSYDHHLGVEESGALASLCDALVESGRKDLVLRLRGSMGCAEDCNLDVCRAEFIQFYRDAMGVVPLLPWYPEEVSKMKEIYVELKLIENKRKTERVAQREIASYEDMLRLEFQDDQPVRYILLYGIAGSGKTTIVSKMAYDWALQSPESPLSKFQLLVALHLRDITDHTSSLTEAIFDQILPTDTKVSHNFLRTYLTSNADKILVILDGVDEFGKEGSKMPDEGDLIDIMSNKMLRGCTVIVTTRPHMVDKMCRINLRFTRVESKGFPENGVKEYIQRFFKVDDRTNSSELYPCLKKSKGLRTLARIPLVLLIICLIWSEGHGLPETLTELFREALFFIIKRHFEKLGQHIYDDEEFIRHELKKIIQELGKTALEGLLLPGQKLVFSTMEFGHSSVVERSCKLGVLSQERVRSKLRVVQHVTFLHKTFQEVIAGFYWAHLAESDKTSFTRYLDLVKEENAPSLEYLLRFCCGENVQAARFLLTHIVQNCSFSWENQWLWWFDSYTSSNEKAAVVLGEVMERQNLCLLMHLEAQSDELHDAITPIFKGGLLFDFQCSGDLRLAFEFLMKCACQPSVNQSFLTDLKEVTIRMDNEDDISVVADIVRHAVNITDFALHNVDVGTSHRDSETNFQIDLGNALCKMPFLVRLLLSGKQTYDFGNTSFSEMFHQLAQSGMVRSLESLSLLVVVDSIDVKKFLEKQDQLCSLTLVNCHRYAVYEEGLSNFGGSDDLDDSDDLDESDDVSDIDDYGSRRDDRGNRDDLGDHDDLKDRNDLSNLGSVENRGDVEDRDDPSDRGSLEEHGDSEDLDDIGDRDNLRYRDEPTVFSVALDNLQAHKLTELDVSHYRGGSNTTCTLGSFPNLEILRFVDDDLKENELQWVSFLLANAPRLREVDLSGNRIGGAFPFLAQQFSKLTSLKELKLENTDLSSQQVELLVNCTLPCLNILETFSISHELTGMANISPQALLRVVQWACHSSSLKHLDLQRCTPQETPQDDVGTLELCEDFETHQSTVETLSIDYNIFSHFSSKLIRLLKQMPVLKVLGMTDMSLTDSDAVLLAEVLPSCKRLEKLSLTSNSFKDAGLENLMKMLPYLPHLSDMTLPTGMKIHSDLGRKCLKLANIAGTTYFFTRECIDAVIATVQ